MIQAVTDRFDAWGALGRLRQAGPLVHCITNYVAMDVTANALLAIGASPAMVHAADEVEEFVSISSALVVNIDVSTVDLPLFFTCTANLTYGVFSGAPYGPDVPRANFDTLSWTSFPYSTVSLSPAASPAAT